MNGDRQQIIAMALTAELARQGKGGVDIQRLAAEVDAALGPSPDLPPGLIPTTMSEGKAPDELNATNDD